MLFARSSPQGRVHGLLGAVVFVAMPVAAAIGSREAVLGRPFRRTSAGCAVLLVSGDLLLKAAELAPGPLGDARGPVQRAVPVVGLGRVAARCLLLEVRARPR